jgi:pSer/pThr/pTyr-binding forkhead associated (FHA) protein
MEGEATNAGRRRTAPACFFVKEGPDTGKQFPLQDVATIGRGRDCTIVLRDPRVSSTHGHIRRVGAQYVFQDLQTANRSFLLVAGNERRLSQSHVLTDGDELRMGHTVLKFIELERGGQRR